MNQGLTLIRPGSTEAMQLLGQWIVCLLWWGDEDEPVDTCPAQVVGVVVPAPGGPVKPQLLMNARPWDGPSEGFEYEIFLDTVMHLHVVAPPRDALRLA